MDQSAARRRATNARLIGLKNDDTRQRNTEPLLDPGLVLGNGPAQGIWS
jgi:hypothetical protein